MRKKAPLFFNLIVPLSLGILLLYYYKDGLRKATDIGLGEGTMPYTPFVGKYPIHIMNLELADSLRQGYIQRGQKDVYLWLGNSQLHGVNQYKAGNSNCIEFIFNKLKALDKEVLGVSYPNANLQEFLVSVIYFSKKLQLKGIIMPVFYDDMREAGIRNEIKIKQIIDAIKPDSGYYSNLNDVKTLKSNRGFGDLKYNDFSGIHETMQDISERFLDKQLQNVSDLWRSRPDIRANIFKDIYTGRNILLGITANTVRKMIPANFEDNYNAFTSILNYCKNNKIPLLVYIPPIRSDVTIPYDLKDYALFKKNVEQSCLTTGATFLNIENLVENKYWGMKKIPGSFSNKGEIDFMHFQEHGHRLIADTIYSVLRKMQDNDL